MTWFNDDHQIKHSSIRQIMIDTKHLNSLSLLSDLFPLRLTLLTEIRQDKTLILATLNQPESLDKPFVSYDSRWIWRFTRFCVLATTFMQPL